jgi:hypothetical protein
VINYAILVLWCVVFRAGHDWHYRLTKKWFPTVTREQYDLVNFGGIAFYKIAILVLNLIPYAAIRLVS